MSKKTYFLIFVLVLAVFLRIWGIGYGLPYFLVNDERALVYGALKMAELKTLIPALHPAEFSVITPIYNFLMSYIYLIFLVPFILIKYLTGNFSSFSELGNYFVLNPTPLWLIARIVNAFIGAVTVYLIYLIGKKMFNSLVGLIAALFLSLSLLHIQLSHFTRTWVPMAFFVCLIMLLSLYIYQSPKRKYYLLMGAVLGLTSGVSIAAIILAAIFFLAHFLSGQGSFWQKLKDGNLWSALFVFLFVAAVFLLINPLRYSIFTSSGSSSTLMAGRSLFEYLQGFASNFKALFFFEPIISIFSLIGMAFLWFKSKKLFFVFLSWPVFWLSAVYFLLHDEFLMPSTRFLLLIIPWLIILASYTVYRLMRRMSYPVRVIFLILIFSYPMAVAVKYDYLLAQKDTRILALEWVEKNIPSGTKLISNWRYINPIPTKEAILFQGELDENSLRIIDKTLLASEDKNYPGPAYNILKIGYVYKEEIPLDLVKIVQAGQYQYFLEESYFHFWGQDRWLPEENQILQKAQLIREFKQGQAGQVEDIASNFIRPTSIFFSLERPGPTIKIYKLY